eukprot:6210321-Pleurochrysis_carterae.AAC.1
MPTLHNLPGISMRKRPSGSIVNYIGRHKPSMYWYHGMRRSHAGALMRRRRRHCGASWMRRRAQPAVGSAWKISQQSST